MRLLNLFTCMMVLAFGYSSAAFSVVNVSLTLTVSGFIAATPQWDDGSFLEPKWEAPVNFSVQPDGGKAHIMLANFSFSGIAGTAAANVDSESQPIRLTNASSYPATVALFRPSMCTIGANTIAHSDVHFLNNGTPVTKDTTFSISNQSLQNFAIRFAAAGNYGDKSGAVSCTQNGHLTYTY